VLEIIKADTFSFTSTGVAIPGESTNNLCVKAYELVQRDFNIGPVAIHLHKVIPTGAGLGGGSSDAAYTLRLLNDVFELRLPPEALQRYAQQLGSDCAFFVQDQPKLGLGRGEILEDIHLTLKNKFLVLLKPSMHVSTADAYRGVVPQRPAINLRTLLESNPLVQWRNYLKNDFEPSVFASHPIIRDYKNKLYQAGAVYASMSGSGSSVFGVFDSPFDATAKFPVDLLWSGILP
jgi:4-diphosphocytidyl-2-C-methyl-D-erythritol kinase